MHHQPVTLSILSALILTVNLMAPAQELTKDVVFAAGEDYQLKMDIAVPEAKAGPYPTVVLIFGGGYMTGSRKNWYFALPAFARKDFVAVAIDHRLTSQHDAEGNSTYAFPTQILDVKLAIRWLRAHAASYHINPDRLALVGYSSGASLALLAGLSGDGDFPAPGTSEPFKAAVKAVVNLAGGIEMVQHHDVRAIYLDPYLGGTPATQPARYRAASPISYVSPDDPPVLTMVGSLDPSLDQQWLLDKTLKNSEIPHQTVVVPDIGHDHYSLWQAANAGVVWEFLRRYL